MSYIRKGLEKRCEEIACAICDDTNAGILSQIVDPEIKKLVEERLKKEGKM